MKSKVRKGKWSGIRFSTRRTTTSQLLLVSVLRNSMVSTGARPWDNGGLLRFSDLWLTSHRRKLSLSQREHSRNPQPAKGRPGEPSLNRYIYKTLPDLRLRKHGGKTDRNRELVLRLGFLVMAEATPIKSHQEDCWNMRWTRVTPTDNTCQSGWGRAGRPRVSNTAQSMTGN